MTTSTRNTVLELAHESRAHPVALGPFVSERRNETAVRCENLHMTAPDIRDSDDDLADLLPDGEWHVTVCEHCGMAVEHTAVNPAYVEIALALHALGHCP